MKRCPDCGEEKAVSEFGLNRRQPDGPARYCKTCFRKRSTESYRKRRAEQGKTVRERVDVPEDHKFCPRCSEIRLRAGFGSNRSAKDGLTSYCEQCHTLVVRENKVKTMGAIATTS